MTTVRETILAAFMQRYDRIKDIIGIDGGITNTIYRRMLADLHTDSGNGNKAAFTAFGEINAESSSRR
jgi:hypothetical protein